MTVTVPPTVDTLRALVRGELGREDRIRVDRWLGRCTDPRMVHVIENLIVEHHEELADAKLPPGGQPLASAFRMLLESGRATLDRIDLTPGLAPSLLQPGLAPLLSVELADPGRRVVSLRLRRRPGRRTLAWATNDLGAAYVLFDSLAADSPDGETPHYELDPAEGRITFWAMEARKGELPGAAATSTVELASWLKQAASSSDAEVASIRIRSDAALAAEEVDGT